MDDPRQPWDRQANESPRAYAMFRRFRDLGPLRDLSMLVDVDGGVRKSTLLEWSGRNDWKDRASAWDDATHRLDDARRLEAIRGMHDLHQRAGRAILTKALSALSAVQPEEIPPYAAARLLELGARLERSTLVVSVEELQGVQPPPEEDPWAAVARELESLPSS